MKGTDPNIEQAAKELFFWQTKATNSFTQMLFTLLMKSDCDNRRKLASVFPAEDFVLRQWMAAGDDGRDFFREHGFLK